MYKKPTNKSKKPTNKSKKPINKSKKPINKSKKPTKKPCESGKRRSRETNRCRTIKKSKTKKQCKKILSKKIRINIEEMKNGRFSSRAQAIAVSYSQTNKKHPSCKKYFNKTTKKD
jgi:hypothetical protein